MKLKSIQISGFKSFADKTTIDFKNGFTGVVGPNGSGKSNVIEAVRWALGEQSAKNLRGKNMKDVIFSGSNNRHQLNRAQVSLIFNNSSHFLDSEYSEVKITRTYYRNGNSIYSINGNECLLRDVHNLFLDTGLGEGSLSIISQGNVDDVLDDDVQKRRSIIETAAGVYKYKQQKNDSEKKLADTQANLDRISDITNEIKKQITPLKEQSEKASLYLRQKKYLDQLSYTRYKTELEQKVKEQGILQNSFTEQQTLQKQDESLMDDLKNKRIEVVQKNEKLTATREKNQNKRLEKTKLLENITSEKELSLQKKSFNLEKQSELKQRLVIVAENKDNLQNNLDDTLKKRTKLNHKILELETKCKDSKLEAIEKELEKNKVSLTNTRNDYLDLRQELADKHNQVTLQEKLSQQTDSNLKSHYQQLNILNQQLDDLKVKISAAKQSFDESYKQQNKLIKDFQALDTEYNAKSNKVDEMNSKWFDALRIFQEFKTEKSSLQSMIENHNTLYQGTKNLLKNRDQLSGILGTVGDLLKVESEYVLSIETTLASSIQNVVVENVSDARKAIKFLSSNSLGRVTFLPMNDVNSRSVAPSVLNNVKEMDGFIDVAANLVSFDSIYSKVIDHLLGNILIVDTIKNATAISNRIGHRVRIVTLTGEVINAGGSITGGKNHRQSEGILSQKERLVKLTDKVSKMQDKLDFGENNIKENQSELKTIQTQKDDLQQKINDYKAQVQINDNNLKMLLDNQVKLEREIKAQELQFKQNNPEIDDNQIDLKNEINKIEKQLADNQHNNQWLNEKIEELEQAALKEQNSLIKVKQELGIQKERFSNITNSLSDLESQKSSLTSESKELEKQIDIITTELNKIEEVASVDAADVKKEVQEIEKQLDDSNSELQLIREQQDKLDKDIADKQQLLLNRSEKLHKLETESTLINQDISHDKAKINNLLEDDSNISMINLDFDKIVAEMGNTSKQINELGPVNIGAISDYQEIKERYEFMNHQMNDLIDSKNQLLETMNKMDETVKIRFEEAFKLISQSFTKVFQNIFGGGEAKLELSDPHHLLTTGIDILVKPPGKRYRSINLLSGGEKALTALALLFAVIEIKAIPFVILDEAESALDPANVDRFARYIVSLKDKNQFIVVTHRKETMVYADDLFGITMQNSGVSKLVSVNLSHNKEEDS
ncbi:chromosome segregation protein SMC [Fructilactobacillus vespulae]|uniref:chromosome segregation protein SMC n=1 Tax=Fructilactobacillus vespulae TaxID=1249630 RepID=UPI0039B627EB